MNLIFIQPSSNLRRGLFRPKDVQHLRRVVGHRTVLIQSGGRLRRKIFQEAAALEESDKIGTIAETTGEFPASCFSGCWII
jgi:hypothetical protein